MKLLIALLVLVPLFGCETIPIKYKFPTPPAQLMVEPVTLAVLDKASVNTDLAALKDESPSAFQLSVIAKSVTDNYKTCNLYREKILSWQDWAAQQIKAGESK